MKTEPTKKPKHAGGRPTVYDPKYVEEIIAFFSVEPYDRISVYDKNGNETFQLVPNKFPTLARFAAERGVTRETLWEWSTRRDAETGELVYPEFSNAYKEAKEFQEACLVEGTMNGAYNSTFSIFAAKNILGWRDNKDLTVANAPGESFKTDVTLSPEESYKAMLEG